MTGDWTVLVPVRSTREGKTRIDLPAPLRRELAVALARDTVRAVAACPAVGRLLVLLTDAGDTVHLAGIDRVGTHVVQVPGLNPGVAAGRDVVLARHGPGPIAVLPGDLPALDPAGLALLLRAADRVDHGVLADAQDEGSTLLTARAGDLTPAFGGRSFDRHRAQGAADLAGLVDRVPTGLRRDIDRLSDLAQLAAAGLLGVDTRTWWERHGRG